MDAVIAEIAGRAWLYSETILAEITEKDRADEPLPVEDSRLRDFITKFKAGSLFLDIFQERELGRLVDEVFTQAVVQTFVFDLRWQSTVGVSEAEMSSIMESIAYTLAPGFQKPKNNGYNSEERHSLLKAMDALSFEDHKWTLSYEVVLATLRYMPWLVPLMLISVGGLYGSENGGN